MSCGSPDIALARELKNHATRNEPVYFDIGAFRAYYNREYVKGYPQIHPMVEYYAGSRPILCFTDSESLVRDLVFLLGRHGEAFSPVVVARDGRALMAVVSALHRQGHLNDPNAVSAFVACGCYGVDLTDYLK